MATATTIKNGNYRTIPTFALFDERLSLGAKGLMVMAMSFNSNSSIEMKVFSEYTKDTPEQCMAYLKELIKAHYCEKTQDGNYIFYGALDFDDEERAKKKASKAKKPKEPKDEEFEVCWVAYRRKGVKKLAKAQWDKLSKAAKGRVLPHLKAYVASRDLVYQKDFERYLRDKVFDTIIVAGDKVIYDPDFYNHEDYKPLQTPLLTFSKAGGYYIYLGWWVDGDTIDDGYEDSKRPNGAKIMLNNARGYIVWNKEKNKWEKQQYEKE